MALPTSATFDLFDWPGGGTPIEDVTDGLIAHSETTVSRDPTYIQNVGTSVELSSSDGIASRITASLNIGTTHTLDFRIKPSSLPTDFTNVNSAHVFVGALDAQGKAAGLLFSQAGLAVSGDFSPSGTVKPLSGSSGLIVDDYLDVRIVVNGSSGTASLYVTLASEVGTTGHVLRHTLKSPSSTSTLGDAAVIDVVGVPGTDCLILLETFRLASTAVVPNKPPVAIAGPDQAVGVGTTAKLDGTSSYDPEGTTVTYTWSILSQPAGSGITLSDVTSATPTFFPDVVGSYEFQLIVSDGFLSSPPSKVFINCLESPVEIGRVPDADFVWSYLPDFWDLISDKGRISSIWSSVIQAAGAEMLRLWQIDYGKSLKDVPRRFTHKWYGYETKVTPTATVHNVRATVDTLTCTPVDDNDSDLTTTGLFMTEDGFSYLSVGDSVVVHKATGPVLATVEKFNPFRVRATGDAALTAGNRTFDTTTTNLLGYGIRRGDTVTFYGLAGSPRYRVDHVVDNNTIMLATPLQQTDASADFQIGGWITLEQDIVDIYELVDSGTATGIGVEDDADTTSPTFSLKSGTFSADIEDGVDILRVAEGDFVITTRDSSTQLTLATELTLDLNQGVDWKIIKLVSGTDLEIEAAPYIKSTTDLDLSIYTSDAIFLRQGTTDLSGYVLAQRKKRAAFRCTFTSSTAVTLRYLTRVTSIPIDEYIRSVPRLQKHSGATTSYLSEAKDYTVGSKILTFTRTQGTDGAVTADSATFTSSSVDLTDTLGQTLFVHDLPGQEGGQYKITAVTDANTVTVDHTFVSTDSSITFSLLPYSHKTPPPDKWWAEYTYVDNAPTIENNFGLLVGLKAEDMAKISGNDYLSSVRALWFALWGGPTVTNIKLGGQVFFGLPFAEVSGTIVAIDDDYSATEGRIIIADKADAAVLRTYYYNLAVGIADKPNTTTPYTTGDTVNAFAPLSKGVTISDYINDPDWYEAYLSGEQQLRKFHTFRVQIDLSGVESTYGYELITSFIRRIKPAHTDFMLTGLQDVDSTVSVTDDLPLKVKMAFPEDPYSTGDGAVHSGTAQAGGANNEIILQASTASPIDDVYNTFKVQITDGTGIGQIRTINDYDGGTVTCTVDSDWDTNPDGTSIYDVINPPPFPAGVTLMLDFVDGRGNWDSGTIKKPFGGEPPTAIVVYDNLSGTPQIGERVDVTSTSNFVGTIRAWFPATPMPTTTGTILLDVYGGSLPLNNVGMTCVTSTATFDVDGNATLGAWPEYAHIDRYRTEVWIPLDPDTIIGPSSETGTLTGATGAPTQTLTLAAGASAEDDTYVNYMLKITSGTENGNHARIESYVGSTKVATLAFDFATDPAGTETYSLHPPKSQAILQELDFFQTGSRVTGGTSGHAGTVYHHGPSYLRLIDVDQAPYSAFDKAEVITGANGEMATTLNEVFYVFPDHINAPDRKDNAGPEPHLDYMVCLDIGNDGAEGATNLGLIVDDREQFQKPFDPNVTVNNQTVPSHGPGLYWWTDKKLVYNHVDTDPAGPGPEPAWVPSPDVDDTETNGSGGWNDNVLYDIVVCRVVSGHPSKPPGIASDPLPDPIVLSVVAA